MAYQASSRSKSDFFGIMEGQFTNNIQIVFIFSVPLMLSGSDVQPRTLKTSTAAGHDLRDLAVTTAC